MDRNSLLYKLRRKGQVLAYRLTSPEFVSKIYFRHVLGYSLNLKNPRTLNEKIQWLKLYYWKDRPDAVRCADKYAVRGYIREKGREDLLNQLLFVWKDAREICWEQLPEQFVLKCNHGCGYNIICRDKAALSEQETRRTLDKWMHEDFSLFNAEPHYGKIPRRIICEKYLGDRVTNYNIYCFQGKAVFFSVAGGLGDGKDETLTYYLADGSRADFRNRSYPQSDDPLTPLLPEMLRTAEFLAGDFPLVRVDLFDVNGRITLSELTFTPGGGLIPFAPTEADAQLGQLLDLSPLMQKG